MRPAEFIDMPADIETEPKESLSDPWTDMIYGSEAFGRYQNWDSKPLQAAKIAGLIPTGIPPIKREQDHGTHWIPEEGD